MGYPPGSTFLYGPNGVLEGIAPPQSGDPMNLSTIGEDRFSPDPPLDVRTVLGQTAESEDQSAGQQTFELGAPSGITGQISVAATATLIRVRNQCRRAIKITNLGATDVWIGFSPSVTPFSGDLLPGAKGAFIVIPATLDIYGITGGGTQTVSYMEVSQT